MSPKAPETGSPKLHLNADDFANLFGANSIQPPNETPSNAAVSLSLHKERRSPDSPGIGTVPRQIQNITASGAKKVLIAVTAAAAISGVASLFENSRSGSPVTPRPRKVHAAGSEPDDAGDDVGATADDCERIVSVGKIGRSGTCLYFLHDASGNQIGQVKIEDGLILETDVPEKINFVSGALHAIRESTDISQTMPTIHVEINDVTVDALVGDDTTFWLEENEGVPVLISKTESGTVIFKVSYRLSGDSKELVINNDVPIQIILQNPDSSQPQGGINCGISATGMEAKKGVGKALLLTVAMLVLAGMRKKHGRGL